MAAVLRDFHAYFLGTLPHRFLDFIEDARDRLRSVKLNNDVLGGVGAYVQACSRSNQRTVQQARNRALTRELQATYSPGVHGRPPAHPLGATEVEALRREIVGQREGAPSAPLVCPVTRGNVDLVHLVTILVWIAEDRAMVVF